jgi:hypothetical protein
MRSIDSALACGCAPMEEPLKQILNSIARWWPVPNFLQSGPRIGWIRAESLTDLGDARSNNTIDLRRCGKNLSKVPADR